MRFTVLTLLFAAFALSSNAQPEGRVSAKLIYHPPSKSLLLIDGYQIHPESMGENPVWGWDGRKWKKIDATGPGSRSLSAGGLNTKTNKIVMFGGVGKKNYETLMDDVWEFDGRTWTQVKVNSIGSRDHHQMVYADHLNAFVVYGGQNGERKFDSATYILKNENFSKMDIDGPGSRYHFGMAYDPSRKKIVLYSGARKIKSLDNDVWEFDGSSWIRIEPAQKIGARVWPSMVYNPKLKMVLLHGGKGPDSTGQFDFSDETWGWDGTTWRLIAKGGPKALLIALGYDPRRDVIVAFGGSGGSSMSADVWELKDSTWKKVSGNGEWEWKDDHYVKIK